MYRLLFLSTWAWSGIAMACQCILAPSIHGQFSIVEQSDRIDVLEAGQLFTSYRFLSGSKPVLWPIIGPDQQKMTRSFPLDDTVEGEAKDHPHHRGLWMTFGDVDGTDWWAEGPKRGVVAHRRVIDAIADGPTARITAEHHWVRPKKEEGEPDHPLLKETCRYTFHGNHDTERIIDCEYLLSVEGSDSGATFGDTKEGMFAIRVPESMRGDRPRGELLNSHGDRGGDVWGKSATWVDYSGPARPDDEPIYGIAILVHPASFRASGLWHARTYGLFAHNPIGIKDFLPHRTPTESGRQDAPHPGGYLLPHKESMHLIYRVVLHRGRWTVEEGNEHWNSFSQTKPGLRSDSDEREGESR